MQSLANMAAMNSPLHGRAPEDPAGRIYLDEYDIERRSIYVGNLPIDAVNDDLRKLFEIYGTILKVTLHKSECKDDGKFLDMFSPSSQTDAST